MTCLTAKDLVVTNYFDEILLIVPPGNSDIIHKKGIIIRQLHVSDYLIDTNDGRLMLKIKGKQK